MNAAPDERSQQPGQGPPPGDGCLIALMLFAGVILLLPGALCAVLNAKLGGSGRDPITLTLELVALGGLALMVGALVRMTRER